MHRKESVEERAAVRNRRVSLRVETTLETRLLLDGLAKQLDMTVEQAVAEALRDWRVRRETALNRAERLRLERSLHEAKDMRTVDRVIADFKQQMERTAGNPHSEDQGLTPAPRSATTKNMSASKPGRTLRERRERLNLSRERLARLADISMASIAKFEGGEIPKYSKALTALEQTLHQQERIAA